MTSVQLLILRSHNSNPRCTHGCAAGDFPQEKDRQQERDFLYNSCMYVRRPASDSYHKRYRSRVTARDRPRRPALSFEP
eukprot:scaffold4058_cov257-Pinguiococcus_pyrenoidosus.AAC.2